MADLNTVILVGRVTRDMELKYGPSGMAFGKLSLAVNKKRKHGDQWVEEVSFFDINLFGKTAEALNQYLVKGKQIAVEGELHQNRWESDGKTHSKVEINANNIQLLGGDKTGQQSTQSAPPASSYTPRSEGSSRPASAPSKPVNDPFDDGFSDDIPF